MKATSLQTTQKKNEKTVGPDRLSIVLELYAEYIRLDLNKALCIGCDICSRVCPTQAVSVLLEGGNLAVDIDENTCVLCEVCTAFCPTNALSMEENGESKAVLALSGGMAEAAPKIAIDVAACPRGCDDCVAVCPRGALSLKRGRVVVDQDRCLRCPHCADACEHGAIRVTPLFEGRLTIDSDKCPTDCTRCVDLCPTRAISREGTTLTVADRYCVLCGACVNACDHEAVDLARTVMYHGSGFSAAWLEGVQGLTGSRAVSGDMNGTAFKRTIEAFRKTQPIGAISDAGGGDRG